MAKVAKIIMHTWKQLQKVRDYSTMDIIDYIGGIGNETFSIVFGNAGSNFAFERLW